MNVKVTLAFIGDLDEVYLKLADRLTALGHPLVLVSGTELQAQKILDHINQIHPESDITIASCEREGCWEADVILLPNSIKPDQGLLEKIKTVANQKTLVFLSHKGNNSNFSAGDRNKFQSALPNSKWVLALLTAAGDKIILSSNDPAAADEVSAIFSNAGYQTAITENILQNQIGE